MTRRATIVIALVVVAGIVVLLAAPWRPDRGSAAYVASRLVDPPTNGCKATYLKRRPVQLRAWWQHADKTAYLVCETAGPGIAWAHFREEETLQAALTSDVAAHFVDEICVTPHQLIGYDFLDHDAALESCHRVDGHVEPAPDGSR